MTASNPMLERIAEMMVRRTALLDEVKHIDADVATLRRAMDIMDGKPSGYVKPTHSEPKAKRPYRRSVLKPGDLSRAVLEVLRDAPEPLTTAEVGKLALAHLRLPADTFDGTSLSSRTAKALTVSNARRTLRRIEADGEPIRWCVAR